MGVTAEEFAGWEVGVCESGYGGEEGKDGERGRVGLLRAEGR